MAKKKTSSRKPKFSQGTGRSGIVRNYLETPEEAAYETNIMAAKAAGEAENGWTQGLDLVGGMMVEYGSSQMGAGGGAMKSGMTQGVAAGSQNIGQNAGQPANYRTGKGQRDQVQFKNGGVAGQANAEIEGEEVIKTPQGDVMQAKGPSHEKGGIDVNLQKGTKVFSKRISKFNESMAERAMTREKKLKRVQGKLDKSPTDRALKNTHKRVSETNAREEAQDLQMQEAINLMQSGGEGDMPKLAGGTGAGGWEYMQGDADLDGDKDGGFSDFLGSLMGNGTNGNSQGSAEKGSGGGMGFGDALSMGGAAYSAIAGKKNTEENRAGDTANVNAYQDYGKDAIETNRKKVEFANQQKANKLKSLTDTAHASKKNNRKGARGINTTRALDFGADQVKNKSSNAIHNDYGDAMVNMLSTEAGLENDRDSKFMAGEQLRDLNDRKDRDNYFTQKGEDDASLGQGMQEIGKDFSQISNRKEERSLVNAQSTRFKWDENKGLTDKQGKVVMSRADVKKKAKQAKMTPEEWVTAYDGYTNDSEGFLGQIGSTTPTK